MTLTNRVFVQETAIRRKDASAMAADADEMERWQQWTARGARHDRLVRERLVGLCLGGLSIAAIAAGAWLSWGSVL